MKNIKIKHIELGTGDVDEKVYEEERKKYIASYQEYRKGYSTGFLGWRDGEYVKRPDIGEATWNAKYSNGYKDWFDNLHVPASFATETRDKINEIIDYLNKNNK